MCKKCVTFFFSPSEFKNSIHIFFQNDFLPSKNQYFLVKKKWQKMAKNWSRVGLPKFKFDSYERATHFLKKVVLGTCGWNENFKYGQTKWISYVGVRFRACTKCDFVLRAIQSRTGVILAVTRRAISIDF